MTPERIKELRAQANEQDADSYDDSQAIHECLDVIEGLLELVNQCPACDEASYMDD